MNSQLASYAVSDKNTKGRQFEIEKAIDRNDFQRDYTRILHSQSFTFRSHSLRFAFQHRSENSDF